MDSSNSDEDVKKQHFSAFSQFDESIEVLNAEEIKSPISNKPPIMRKSAKIQLNEEKDELDINSPRGKQRSFRR